MFKYCDTRLITIYSLNVFWINKEGIFVFRLPVSKEVGAVTREGEKNLKLRNMTIRIRYGTSTYEIAESARWVVRDAAHSDFLLPRKNHLSILLYFIKVLCVTKIEYFHFLKIDKIKFF